MSLQTDHFDSDHSESKNDGQNPYASSSFGEYGRILLLLLASLLVIAFGIQYALYQTGIVFLVESVVLLLMLIWLGGAKILRIGILCAMTVNVASIVANASYLSGKGPQTPGAMITVLLICLLATLAFESIQTLKSSFLERTKVLSWLLLAIPAFVYVIGLPAVDMLVESFQESEQTRSAVDPNWTFTNEASFRFAKLAVFAAFTYLGACLGSFLNVVAYSLPRGQSIGMRDSSCPKCKTKIRRIDNLPVFSYLNLGGSCRSCKSEIPVRYLAVEVIAAIIFGSLFLYELVTGCWNVPLFGYAPHKGVLWMILYPKWHVIGTYAFHVLFMCGLLTLALVELDGQRLKWWHQWIPLLVFVALAAAIPVLLMTPVKEKLPFAVPWENGVVAQALRPVIGAVLGFLIGCGVGNLPGSRNWLIPGIAFAATGAVLGWQGLVQVTVVFAILLGVGLLAPRLRPMLVGRSVAVLLAAVLLHHPFWNVLFGLW